MVVVLMNCSGADLTTSNVAHLCYVGVSTDERKAASDRRSAWCADNGFTLADGWRRASATPLLQKAVDRTRFHARQ
jgi:hypothetical protein